MNLITAFKAERLISQIRGHADPASADAKRAFQKLEQLGPGAIPKILDAVGSADRGQTAAYVEILTHLCNDKTMPIIARGLMSDDPKAVKAAKSALTTSTRYNVNQLVTMLGEDGYSKGSIVEVLAAHKDRLNMGRLLSHVGFLEPAEQGALFRIVGEIAKREALPDLILRLDGKDPIVKTHLIGVISNFDTPEVHEALEQSLQDKNKLVRQAALNGVTKMNGAMNVELICRLLLDNDLEIQDKAVEVIVRMNRPETFRHLIPALKSENEFSRRNAVEILNEIGTSDSVKVLLEAVADDDWWVRSRACDALARIGGDRVRRAVLDLIRDKDENIRRAAIEIINTNPDKSTVDHLMSVLKDDDWWVRERAADALAAIGDKRAVPALLEMLKRNDRGVPIAIQALGRLGDAKVLKELLAYVGRPEKDVAVAAIDAVAQLTDERVAESVKAFLRKKVSANADATIIAAAERAIHTLENKGTSLGSQQLTQRRQLGGSGSTPQPSGATAAASTPPSAAQPPSREVEDVNATMNTLLGEGPEAEKIETIQRERADAQVIDISTLENGDIIDGRYKFIEKIGKGAFGTVLLVEDTVVQERLILKFLNPNVASDEEMMKRFVHELRYSRRITHKNVIRIYDFLYIGGGYAISMEYFPSHTLGAEIAKENPMPIEKALRYASDICVGMHIAHQQGIIHRDLKPANILINDEGLLKIVDFGVAAAAKSGDTQLTKTGYVIGSPKYMAPEQILGKKVDERADIYSLGVILYEMVLGSPPYSRGDHMSVMYQHVQGKAPNLHDANPNIPTEISDIVAKAMMVDKSKRYESMLEFHAAIMEVMQQPA